MSGKYDPLSELFDKAKLTGLSNTRSSSTQPPLQFDLSELEESSLEEPELPLDLPKKPVSPPREEVSENVVETKHIKPKPASPPKSSDVQVKMKLLMAQQQMQRRRMAILEEEDVADSTDTTDTEVEDTSVASSVANRLDKFDGASDSLSAMDLFLAAMEESKDGSPKSPVDVKPMAESTPPVEQPLTGNQLTVQLETMIQSHLPQLKEFHVANAMDTFDRPLLKAIWTTHRTKFLMSGQLEYAIASLSVIDALTTVPSGYLVAAYVETTASDYLIWVDFTKSRLVAAFADAGSYFG